MSEERELSEAEASKAVMLLVLEEAVTAVKSLVGDMTIDPGKLKEAEGLLKHMMPSVLRAMRIIKAVDSGVSELRHLVEGKFKCECDASVGMAPCFECALNDVVNNILKAVDLPVTEDETEEEILD